MSSQKFSCIVSGVQKRLSKQSIEKKLLKFGTVDMLQKFFVCREAKGLLRKNYSIDQVREKLNTPVNYPKPNLEVLFKLKLLKNRKSKGPILSEEERMQQDAKSAENERNYYEHKEKMTTCLKTWVEWATGGPNKCQVKHGGTCVRPDIYYNHEFNKAGRCSPCPYKEFCLCTNKEVV
jgi:hypothetical protein